MSAMIIHISEQRYRKIQGQGWNLTLDLTSEQMENLRKKADTEFHLLTDERARCNDCGEEFNSVEADTPADLENIKWRISHEQFEGALQEAVTAWLDETGHTEGSRNGVNYYFYEGEDGHRHLNRDLGGKRVFVKIGLEDYVLGK